MTSFQQNPQPNSNHLKQSSPNQTQKPSQQEEGYRGLPTSTSIEKTKLTGLHRCIRQPTTADSQTPRLPLRERRNPIHKTTVVWHSLVNSERYVEEGFSKVSVVRMMKASYGGHVLLEAMAEVLRNAGYTVVANG